MNINGKWYTETELAAYVKELEARVSELEDKHFSECGQIAHYSDELNEVNSYAGIIEDMATKQTISGMDKNAELRKAKELLKAAEEVARRTAEYGKASPVDFLDLLDENAKLKELLKKAVEDFALIGEVQSSPKPNLHPKRREYIRIIDVLFNNWRYADEVLALIGGAENDTRRNP